MHKLTYSIILVCIIISLIILSRTNAESSEQDDHSVDSSAEEFNDMVDVYRRASLRPVIVQQRASLRPFTGKRASLRPFGKRASLRPFGKRASLRPVNYFGK